jgi:hypothetical protein
VRIDGSGEALDVTGIDGCGKRNDGVVGSV